MLNTSPTQIAVWTEAGRDDRAAEIGLTAQADGSVQIAITAPSSLLTYLALRWDYALPEEARILGDHWERGYGDLEWRGAVAERALPWYALIYDPQQGETLGVGVDTGPACFASWRVDQTGITLVLDVRCGGRGVQLGGRRLDAATVRTLSSQPGEALFAFARRFCAALCRTPRLPAQPVYGGNDWYSRYGVITAETVRRDSAEIRALSPSTDNAPWYVIDSGWFPRDEAGGETYDRGNAGFPDLPGLAAWMQSEGIRPGIWTRPLLNNKDAPQAWQVGPEHPLADAEGVTLDPSVPEVLERVRADIGRLTEWGYRMIKHDFSTYDITGRWGLTMGPEITPNGWAFADRTRTTAEIIRTLYGVIRDAAGDALLIGCNTVSHLGAGVFDLARTGDDTSGREWERTRKMGINTLAFRMPQHGTFYCTDADCVGLRAEIPWEENRQWLDILSRSATALFVSAHPNALGPAQREALREAFGRAAQPAAPAEPLDWLETTCPRRWQCGDETHTYNWHPFPGAVFACPG